MTSVIRRPLYIFIDGIDEVHPNDGPIKVLTLVNELIKLPETKLCLVSRPEYAIGRRLSQHRRLRVQGLNYRDLEHYAEENITTLSTSVDEHRDIIDLLLRKAEGVCLLLCLAIKSVHNGLHNGDSSKRYGRELNSFPTTWQVYARICGCE